MGKSLISKLGITKSLPQVVDLVENNDKCCVQAPTGLGKSLGIPFALAQTGQTVYVSVPTRAAARALCDRQRQLIQNAIAKKIQFPTASVGFAAEGERDYTKDSKIVYGTTGHWVKRLLGMYAKNRQWADIDFCDVFIIDEVHTGTMDNDVLMALFNHAESTVKIPKLMLSSATFNPERYPAYKPLAIPVEGYPIEIRYSTVPHSMNNDLYNQACKTVVMVLKDDSENQLGHILVFAPGATEIEMMVQSLEESISEDIWVLPAYSALKREDLDQIFLEDGSRKIVVATNIAETSLTINGVGVVVDTLTEKRGACTAYGGTRLMLHKVSKDSAEQRKGRTGRTRPGIVYRMCTEEDYAKLEDRRPDEITQVGIYNLVLSLLDVGLNPMELLKDKLTEGRIQEAIDLLIKLKLVEVPQMVAGYSTNRWVNATVTEMGHFAPQFPLSARLGAILYRWIKDQHASYVGVVIMALLECYGPSPFFFPRRNRMESLRDYCDRLSEHKAIYFTKYQAGDEVQSMVRMWNHLIEKVGLNGTWDSVKWHCIKNSLNNKKIREVVQCVRRCLMTFDRMKIEYQVGQFELTVMKDMGRYLYEVFDDRKMHRSGNNFSDGQHYYKLDDRRCVSDFEPGNAIIALMDAEIVDARGSTFRIINVAVECDSSSSDSSSMGWCSFDSFEDSEDSDGDTSDSDV